MSEVFRQIVKHTKGIQILNNAIHDGLTFPQGVEMVVRDMGQVNVAFEGEQLQEIIQHQPVLVIANHDFASPLAVLATLAQRKSDDTYMFIDANFSSLFLEVTQQKFLPIHKSEYKRRISPGYLLHVFSSLRESPDEIHKKNFQSLENAQHILQEKGMVVLFPSGGDDENNWKQGVGIIVKDLICNDIPFHLVGAYVNGVKLLYVSSHKSKTFKKDFWYISSKSHICING